MKRSGKDDYPPVFVPVQQKTTPLEDFAHPMRLTPFFVISMIDDKQHLPEETDFQNIGRDHNRHRGSIRGLNEIFGLCLVSFGQSTFDVVGGLVRTGYPGFPGLFSLILFASTIAAIPVAFRRIGPASTLSDRRRRSWRFKLIIGIVLAIAPIAVGVVGQILRVAIASAK